MMDMEAEKEAYFKSFETDSFDLSECFNGSTQPSNSSMLKRRLEEREGILVPAGRDPEDNKEETSEKMGWEDVTLDRRRHSQLYGTSGRSAAYRMK